MAERRPGTTGWIVAIILLLLLGAGVVYFWPKIPEENSLNQELADLQSANATLVAEKTQTQTKISELEKAKADLETTKQSLSDANRTLADQVTKLVGDRDTIKKSEVYFARVYNEALAKNDQLGKDNEALRKEIARLKAENERLTADNKRLQAQYDRLLAEKQAAETVKREAENKVAGLNADIDLVKRGKEAAEIRAAKAEQSLAKTEAGKMDVQAKVVDLNAQIINALVDKKALQDQLNTAKKALEAAEGRLAASDKLVAKAPTEDTVKENLALKAEIQFLYALILVATSGEEKGLSQDSRQKATNLMVRMTYQSDPGIRFSAAAKIMEEMPKNGAESIDQLHTRWRAWKKTQE